MLIKAGCSLKFPHFENVSSLSCRGFVKINKGYLASTSTFLNNTGGRENLPPYIIPDVLPLLLSCQKGPPHVLTLTQGRHCTKHRGNVFSAQMA